MRLILVRHAQTPMNVSGVLDAARPGPGLTPLGHEQAAALPAALAGEALHAIYVSPLVRTGLTAAPLAEARGLAPEVVEGVEEIEAGALQGSADHADTMRYVRTVRAWGRGELDTAMPGGPDGNDFFRRYDDAIARIADAHPDGAVAVVSHGAAIRLWVGVRAANWDEAERSEHFLDNTGVVVLEGDAASGWRMLSWQGVPAGGADLADAAADDPTGDARL